MAPNFTPMQYDLIYNYASLGLASMRTSTAFFFLRLPSFHDCQPAEAALKLQRLVEAAISLPTSSSFYTKGLIDTNPHPPRLIPLEFIKSLKF